MTKPLSLHTLVRKLAIGVPPAPLSVPLIGASAGGPTSASTCPPRPLAAARSRQAALCGAAGPRAVTRRFVMRPAAISASRRRARAGRSPCSTASRSGVELVMKCSADGGPFAAHALVVDARRDVAQRLHRRGGAAGGRGRAAAGALAAVRGFPGRIASALALAVALPCAADPHPARQAAAASAAPARAARQDLLTRRTIERHAKQTLTRP